MEKLGGALLLQELAPKRLLGSLASKTEESGPGWIRFCFFPEKDVLSFQEEGGQACLVLDRGVTMSLISSLHVLVEQNRVLRNEGEGTARLGGTGQAVFSVRRDMREKKESFTCCWAAGTVGIEQSLIDEQIDLWIRDDLAEELALRLIHCLARIAAGR